MTSAMAFAVTGTALIAIGFYGFVVRRHLLRRIVAFNIIGSGVFLLFGALARQAPEGPSDPVPQAMIITGIVVALAATALGVALVASIFERTGEARLPEEREEDSG
jgi:multicomponent Na+:H+ antiporter subunit C